MRTVLNRHSNVQNTGQGNGILRVGVMVWDTNQNPDKVIRSFARGVASEEGFRRLNSVGPITSEPGDERGTVWHRAVFRVGR